MSALRLINETEITSSVSSVNVTDVFSADFDIYQITYSEAKLSINASANCRFINSSGSVVTANYDYADASMYTGGAFGENRNPNATFLYTYFGVANVANTGGQAECWLFNPYSSSSYTFSTYANTSYNGTNLWATKGIAVLHELSSITGFQFYPSTGTINGGFLRTYGLRVDNG